MTSTSFHENSVPDGGSKIFGFLFLDFSLTPEICWLQAKEGAPCRSKCEKGSIRIWQRRCEHDEGRRSIRQAVSKQVSQVVSNAAPTNDQIDQITRSPTEQNQTEQFEQGTERSV